VIVAKRKPVGEIKQALEGYEKILIVGCGTCVAVCMAGGEREVGILASLACGIGVQFLSELYDNKVVIPGVNTTFLGSNEGEGVWQERCRACGECVLAETGGICPITFCPKGLLNGPCDEITNEKCEVDRERDCIWILIYRRLEKIGKLGNIRKIFPARNYQINTRPVRLVHEAYQKSEIE
jgi:ferredoxin